MVSVFGSEHEQHSLFGEILDWMLAPLLLLWPMSIILTYVVAQNIAHGPYDRELAQVVRTIARQAAAQVHAGGAARPAALPLPASAAEFLRADEAENVFYQVRGPGGELLAGDAALPPPTTEPVPGGEVQLRDDAVDDQEVRVAYLWLPVSAAGGTVLVQVAETLDRRAQLANEIIKGVILPQFVILPVAVVLVWLALARGIKPLARLQRRIRGRDGSDLTPIDDRDVPDEVAPLVGAFNDLLGRLDQSISTQKHFLADAAHQLKTPLAGLRMQAELAARTIETGASDPAALKTSLEQIASSSQRAAHTVNQLLAMARAEDREQALQPQPFSLARTVIETVHDFVPRAMDKQIDLGYEGPEPDADPPLSGQPVLVRELVRNLVDNALQYTPAGGTVTARVVAEPRGRVVVLQVEDTGPGIAEHERELVFQPFYRSPDTAIDGSGLGLAIAREVVQHHGAEIDIVDAIPRAQAAAQGGGPGTLITVRFPVQPRPAEAAPVAAAAPARVQ